jgi:hypothetical protein
MSRPMDGTICTLMTGRIRCCQARLALICSGFVRGCTHCAWNPANYAGSAAGELCIVSGMLRAAAAASGLNFVIRVACDDMRDGMYW